MKKVGRIAFDLLPMGYGGSTTYVRELLRRMGPSSFPGNIDLFLGRNNSSALGDLPSNVELHVLPTGKGDYLGRAWLQRYVLPKLVKSLRIEVVFSAVGPTAFAPVARNSGSKLVTALHNMLPFETLGLGLRNYPLLERLRLVLLRHALLTTFKHSDRHIFLSRYSCRKVLPLLPGLKDYSIVPNGITPCFAEESPVQELEPRVQNWLRKDFTLYVSILHPYKRHIELVKGYAEARKRGFSLPLLLVGPDQHAHAATVRRQVQELRLQDSVFILGPLPQDQLSFLAKRARLLLFASTCETSPFILLEYLATGVPIICSNTDPMPEFGGDACEYVNAVEQTEWTEALLRLTSDENRRRTLAVNAKRRIQLYDMKKCAEETLRALTEW